MMRGLCVAIGLALLAMTDAAAPAGVAPQYISYSDLKGWGADDQGAALAAFRLSCGAMTGAEWQAACAAAVDATDARAFFEQYFRPALVGGARKPTLFTGYYEPELNASLTEGHGFAYPIYRKPPELRPGEVWYDRAEIETRGLLRGRGLELAWLNDPVDVFFLQIQGSGRLKLTDGRVMRVGFAAKNGQPYRSIGAELVRRGLFTPSQMSAQAIRHWIHANPEGGKELFRHNPSFVFFRELALGADTGPLGAMQVPVTPGRSLAVDPDYIPLGAPVWVETKGTYPLHRLMVAQDIGSAIKTPWRADVFVGTGHRAGEIAGGMRDKGRMVVLLPRPLGTKVAELPK
jgi:membrane-bound lytic murein transglycosylase A